MSLVVYSNRPLSELRAVIVKLFSTVPDRQLGKLSYDHVLPAFTRGQMSIIRRIKTVSQTKKITLKFILPAYRDQFDSNPVEILEFLIGHEGKGSLLSLLLRLDLAVGLSASHEHVADYFTFLTVEVELTQKGLLENQTVIELFFAYVREVIKQGLTKDLLEEIRQTNNIKFKFQNKTSELDKTVTTAQLLADYPPELVNKVKFLYDRFDPEGFQELLAKIIPENLVIILQNQDFDELSEEDPFFGTLFDDEPIDPSFIRRIHDILEGKS